MKETHKKIILIDKKYDLDKTITSGYGIYEIYNDWLISDDHNPTLSLKDKHMIEIARDYNQYIFEKIENGTYTIREFEKRVKKLLPFEF